MSVPTGIPGTSYLVDIDHHSNLQHRGDIILPPTPTEDPNDPLNWTRFRKNNFIFWPILFTFFAAAYTSSHAVAIIQMAESFGCTVAEINYGSGYGFLMLGWANIVLQPCAVSYGRRPIVLLSALVGGVISPIWLTRVTTIGGFYACRIVGVGIFLAPVESLIEILVADVFFTHQRAFWMNWYVWALYGGSFLGPIASGFVLDSMGWQWIFYFYAIFNAAIFVGILFFFEESIYPRKKLSIERDDPSNNGNSEINGGEEEGVEDISREGKTDKIYSVNSSTAADGYPHKTYLQRMRLFSFSGRHPTLSMIIRPVLILWYFPHILWAGLMVSSSLSAFQILTGTVASVLTVPPYNFSGDAVGLSYFGPVIGATIGCLIGGPFQDWLTVKLARRNNGVMESEFRIYPGILNLIFMPCGLWLYGIGAAHQISWVGVVFGLSIFSGTAALASAIPYTYAIDAANDIAPEAIVAIILVRNTVSFAFTYSIVPWIDSQGLQNTFIAVGCLLGILFWITMFPMIKWGKAARIKTKARLIKYAESSAH